MLTLDEKPVKVDYNVEVFSLPADFTYEDYQRLTEREREGYLHERVHNLVLNAGLDQIVDLMIATDTSSFTHCGVGSSSQAAAAGDTDLITAIGSRVAVTNRYKVSTGEAHFDTFFSSSANAGTWQEVIIANASSAGDALNRTVISSFTKSSSNSAVVAVTVTLARA